MHDLSVGVAAVIEKFGSRAAVAAFLNIERTAIYQWKRVPVERVLTLEEKTGIPRHEMRPDIYPAPAKRKGRAA